MAEITNQQKVATVGYVETILHKLQDWMPLKRKDGGIFQDSRDENGEQTLQTTNTGEIALGSYNVSDAETILSVGIGQREERKNAISVKQNGEIFIITDIDNYKVESLQHVLDNKANYSALENYVQTSELSNYVTTLDFNAYKESVTQTLNNYVTDKEFTDYQDIVTAALSNKLEQSDLSDYVTSGGLETVLADYVTSESLDTTLADYVTSESLDATLADYVTSESLETTLADYVTSESIDTALADYVTSESLETVLADYATTDALTAGLATKADESSLDSYVLKNAIDTSESLSFVGDKIEIRTISTEDLTDIMNPVTE